jgi:hypothetical protein
VGVTFWQREGTTGNLKGRKNLEEPGAPKPSRPFPYESAAALVAKRHFIDPV